MLRSNHSSPRVATKIPRPPFRASTVRVAGLGVALREAEAILGLRTERQAGVESRLSLTLDRLFGRYVSEGKYQPDGSLKTESYLRHVATTGDSAPALGRCGFCTRAHSVARGHGVQGAIGNTLLFPHPNAQRRANQPVTRHLAAWWLKEAFRRDKLQKPAGSLWHMFRRVWATERKHLPPKDVAAAEGWLDTGTLQQCYQQPDDDTLRAVVAFERPHAPAYRAAGSSRQLSGSELTQQLTR